MGYVRGTLGIEYDPVRQGGGTERHVWRWVLAGACALAAVSFATARGCVKRIKMPDFSPPLPQQQPLPPEEPTPPPPQSQGQADPAPPVPKAALAVKRWLAAPGERPPREKTLLEKLLAAECSGNAALAINTIERLRMLPAMADLDDPLARRLGELDMQLLLSGKPTPWTAAATVRKGDSIYRIARENGTTVAAVCRLNNLAADAKPAAGSVLRVMKFPRAALVVHKRTKQADLSLNGRFFKRYYASTGAASQPCTVMVTREAGPKTRFAELAIRFVPADLEEVAMFLPPGASITLADP